MQKIGSWVEEKHVEENAICLKGSPATTNIHDLYDKCCICCLKSLLDWQGNQSHLSQEDNSMHCCSMWVQSPFFRWILILLFVSKAQHWSLKSEWKGKVKFDLGRHVICWFWSNQVQSQWKCLLGNMIIFFIYKLFGDAAVSFQTDLVKAYTDKSTELINNISLSLIGHQTVLCSPSTECI